MKKVILTSLATMGLALGAFAQGAVSIDNSGASEGLTDPALGAAGTESGFQFYAGTAGVQVWFLNGTAYNVATINSLRANPAGAYSHLSGDGFTLATQFTGAAITSGGFSLGDAFMATVSPGGSKITMAIAAWKGSGASFAGFGGVLAFQQPTRDYVAAPTLSSPDLTAATGGFNTTDLVLNSITAATPEPSTFALAGLGAAALLIFRRRK